MHVMYKVFAFSHLSWDKVFHFHTPKNCTWENEKLSQGEEEEEEEEEEEKNTFLSLLCRLRRR